MSGSLFLHRALIVIGLVAGAALVLALLILASDVFLLLFAGILLAVLLRVPTNWLLKHTDLREGVALALAIMPLAALIVLTGYLFAMPIGEQLAQLAETLPRALQSVREWARQFPWSRPLASFAADLQRMPPDIQWLGRATGMISSTLQGVGSLIVVIFVGVYLAAQPRLYQHGVLQLLPARARPRARSVLDDIGDTLKWWLLGRLITMVIIGLAAGLGLWWLGVPLALSLGIVSGLLEFVPYFGPILASIPALLIAFNVDPQTALYVLMLYIAIQTAENYLLSPLIEQRTVSLPPALVIFSTLVLAKLFGLLGVVIASPLTAASIVAVRRLYIEKEERNKDEGEIREGEDGR